MIYKLLLDGFDIFNQQDDRKLLNSNVSIELNAAGSCEFTMPVSHRYYDLVSLLNQTLEIYDENDTVIWFGRPTEITTDFYNQKKVYFEGPMAFFGDTIQRPHEYPELETGVRSFFRQLIANHNDQVLDPNRRFTVGNLTIADDSIYRKTDYETTKECIERMCIDAEGGYMFFRRENGVNYIDWLSEETIVSNQPIMYAVNLKDIEQNINCDDVFSCLIPLGGELGDTGERLTIADVNDGIDYLMNSEAYTTYGKIYKVVEFDQYADASTETKNKLKAEGQRYLTKKWTELIRDRLSLTISAADLGYIDSEKSTLKIGRKVRVFSTPHAIDETLPITKIDFSLDSGVKDISIGTRPRQTLTEITYEG